MARVRRRRRTDAHFRSAALKHLRALREMMMSKRRRQLKSFLSKRPRHSTTHIQNYFIKYSFDTTGDGKLELCGTPVSVHRHRENFPPLHLVHPNILRIHFNDYLNGFTIYSRRGLKFCQWLKQGIKSVKPYFVDDEKNLEATFIPLDFRIMFQGVLNGLIYIHENGYAIKDLSENNICMVDGMLKMWKMEVVEVCDESRRQNFNSMHRILSKVIEKLALQCPEDMKNLLDILESTSITEVKETIMSHMALLSPSKRLFMVSQILDLKWYSEQHGKIWEAAALKFFQEANLNKWYDKYQAKIVGHVRKCYRGCRKKNPYKTSVDGSTTKQEVVTEFIRFLRNMAYHVCEKKGEVRNKEKMDAILFWAFGKEIILFIKCLKDKGLELDVEREEYVLREETDTETKKSV